MEADPVEVELRRVVDRLRSLSVDRLARPAPPWPSAVAGAHATAQRLADLAAGLEGGPRRAVPTLRAGGAGDQVAVTGHDLLAAAAAYDVTDPRRAAALGEGAAALARLRRALP